MTLSAIDRHVGARLRFRRSQLGKSQAELALKLGLTAEYYARVESGLERAGADCLRRICFLLKMDPADVFRGLGMRGAETVFLFKEEGRDGPIRLVGPTDRQTESRFATSSSDSA